MREIISPFFGFVQGGGRLPIGCGCDIIGRKYKKGQLTMFKGFTERTGSFFWDLAFNNERPWFMEHKEEFEREVNLPFKALSEDTMALMEQRWPEMRLKLHISRIYKDARRLHGSGPYKDHLWFSIKVDDQLLTGPMFWFEVGARDYGCGMGFYSATAAQMAELRAAIDANPARFERIASAVEAVPELAVTGEEYARPKAVREGVIGRWYNRRRMGVELERDFGVELYDPELPKKLVAIYEKLMPLYMFLQESYTPDPKEYTSRR